MNTRRLAMAFLVLAACSRSADDAGIVLNVDTEVMADRTRHQPPHRHRRRQAAGMGAHAAPARQPGHQDQPGNEGGDCRGLRRYRRAGAMVGLDRGQEGIGGRAGRALGLRRHRPARCRPARGRQRLSGHQDRRCSSRRGHRRRPAGCGRHGGMLGQGGTREPAPCPLDGGAGGIGAGRHRRGGGVGTAGRPRRSPRQRRKRR